MKFFFLCLGSMWLSVGAALAEAAEDDFIHAKIVSVFYHELEHAIIDVMRLPIFGQEEDAADVLSILLIDEYFEEDSAQEIAKQAAFGFLAEAEDVGKPAFWDVHGPDEQRYYNLVCLFYGANPDERLELAQELNLPPERGESCEEEFQLAYDSWGPVLDEMENLKGYLEFDGSGEGLIQSVIKEELAYLKGKIGFPSPVRVFLEACGEANAFYDPNETSIILCTEFEDHLRRQFKNM